MNTVTFEALAHKFENLPERDKKTVFDFIDFLSRKRKPRNKKIDKKKILLGMSYWSDEDITILEDIRKDMNKWQPEAF
jgi:hypothetical protein